jgi:hypothetical protein
MIRLYFIKLINDKAQRAGGRERGPVRWSRMLGLFLPMTHVPSRCIRQIMQIRPAIMRILSLDERRSEDTIFALV